MREIHTRMPVILPEEHLWFSGEAGKEILVPYLAWPISSDLNSPINNDAEIIVPIELNPKPD